MIKIKGNMPLRKKIRVWFQLSWQEHADKRFIKGQLKARGKAIKRFNRFKKLS